MGCERTPLGIALALALLLGLAHGDVVQFIFGDSLSDVGNNNYLTKSLARAALPWYGIDFGSGMPNGRFCNGRTVADIIGDKMGLPRPPAFLDPSVDETVIAKSGLNYASGGGGILNETSSLFIQRFSLYKQIELFQGTQAFMREKIGQAAADKLFGEAYYVVAMGANDFINNYLLPVYSDSWTYNGDTFVKYMESTNKLALSFNKQAGAVIKQLAASLPNATFQFGDVYDYFQDIIDRPYMHGFNNSHAPCCTLGKVRPTLTCTPLSTLCKDRSKYVFWDEYHPTDRANELIALETLKRLNITVVANTTSS
ncbi:unnamed protein product [Triticum turgidum subsp. durum]|uniref:GDSL esterase/lipase n=1 Tax=Triticum turgidum subsp. durum TaxID=4567 RepID=A0A9R0ZWE0_TRITD|nr:unnamed protein product [Triticum turgidum subsp. durum]